MSEELYVPEAAEYTGYSPATLAVRRCRGLPPRSWKALNGRVKYAKADLDSFIEQRKQATMRGETR